MDLRFGEHEEQLRQEVRSFLQTQLKDRPTNPNRLGETPENDYQFAVDVRDMGYAA